MPSQLLDLEADVSQPWLLPKGERSFELQRAAGENDYQLQVGDRPYAVSIRKLFETKGEALPPAVAAMPGDVYLIAHTVSVYARANAGKVQIVGYQAVTTEPCSTIDMCPNTRFHQSIAGGAKFSSSLSADGHAMAATPQIPVGNAITLGADAELKLGAGAYLVGELSLSVKTPVIQAIGCASSCATWEFQKDEFPLVGDQVMVQTILVPRTKKTIKFKVQAWAVIRQSLVGRLFQDDIHLASRQHELSVTLEA